MINIHLSPKAIVRFILPSIYIKVWGTTICSTGWQPHDGTSTYIPATIRSWCKCFMWIWVLGIGTLPVYLPSVREVPPTIRGVPYPAATPPFGVNCKCLGDDALLHASRGVKGVWKLEQTLSYIPSGHCLVRVLRLGLPCACSAVNLASKSWKACCATPGIIPFNFNVEWSHGLAALLLRLNYDHGDSWLLECCCRPW